MSVGRAAACAGRCADDVRFAQLYERYYRPIRDFSARRVPRDAVDDAVADTFLTVWRQAAGFDRSRGKVSTWILMLVHRRAVDAGHPSLVPPMRLDRWPVTIAFVGDPDGYQVELVQRHDD